MEKIYSIAIDGPSGAGKSTVAKILAERLNILYLDTGAMYRAIGLKCYRNNIDVNNKDAVLKVLSETSVDVVYQNNEQKVLLDGIDVGTEIRLHQISAYASTASAIPEVRLRLVEAQRAIAQKQCTVLDGRDIGTYVLPNAKFKFFVTADADVRAMRRVQELLQKGQNADFEQIKQDIIIRDHNDMTRDFAPLKQAEDAKLIDTSSKSIDEVVEIMYNHVVTLL